MGNRLNFWQLCRYSTGFLITVMLIMVMSPIVFLPMVIPVMLMVFTMFSYAQVSKCQKLTRDYYSMALNELPFTTQRQSF